MAKTGKREKIGAEKVGGEKAEAKRAEKRIPKTVAGVKLPKDLRRAGDTILAKVATPEGKAMLAGGVSMAMAGIAALAERRTPAPSKPSENENDVAAAEKSAPAGAPVGIRDPQVIVEAVGGAVEAAIGRILKRF